MPLNQSNHWDKPSRCSSVCQFVANLSSCTRGQWEMFTNLAESIGSNGKTLLSVIEYALNFRPSAYCCSVSIMSYFVRNMELRDVAQAAEIEREAFPLPWPATNFKRELASNNLVQYFVGCEESPVSKEQDAEIEAVRNPNAGNSRFETLKSGLKRLLGIESSPAARSQFVLGFAGLWFMADEAHLANIAVREAHRRRGIGESLFIATIELAIERKARFITLEVRVSNKAAQALYSKYGLVEVGTRRGYYMDNKEDAVIMTAEAITSELYLDSFQRLKQAHAQRWGAEFSSIIR